LRNGFQAEGEVRLFCAEIYGHLECEAATFKNADAVGLNAEGATINGAVLLRDGFRTEGGVRLLMAEIGSDLDMAGADLTRAGVAGLNASRAVIKGILRIEDVATGPDAWIYLWQTSCNILVDDTAS